MNYSMIRYALGSVIAFEGLFLILPCIVSLIYQEQAGFGFLIMMAVCLLLGLLLILKKPKNKVLYAREGFVIVALSWICLSILGALPFVLNGEIPNFTDALFETISGFTTTGASILTDVEALSKCSLFWRSFTHWIGGMGVLVFILAILPLADGYNIHLMRAESPGPSVGKLVPKVRHTVIWLYGIYFAMTVVEIILLLAGGMSMFEALTLSFGTAGTGGFGILNSSISSYTPYIQYVIAIFMLLFGVNFNVYYFALIRHFKEAVKYEELRYYLIVIVSSTLLIMYNIRHLFPTLEEAFRHAFFQVNTVMTTTGYSTTDFNLWPEFSKGILVVLMLVGACAGSTGGGFKVSRVFLLIKSVFKELVYYIHPHSVKKVRWNRRQISHEELRSVNVYLVTYVGILLVSALIVSLDNFDFTTNVTAVIAAFNNIGPGLSMVGPTGNFSMFSVLSKYVLMFDMLAGRLEIFPMLLLFTPITWKGSRKHTKAKAKAKAA